MSYGVSVLIPSRGRPKRLFQTIESIQGTASEEVEILTYIDDDDPQLPEYFKEHIIPRIQGPRLSLSQSLKALEKRAKHYFLMLGSDDIIFKTHGWDRKMKSVIPRDGIGVVFSNDGWKNAPNHLLYTKRLVELTGVFPAEFEHFGPDTYVTDCMRSVDRLFHVQDVLIEHNHFRNGKVEKDETYAYPRDNMCNQRDKQRLEEFRKTRMPKDIAVLKAEIERFSKGA